MKRAANQEIDPNTLEYKNEPPASVSNNKVCQPPSTILKIVRSNKPTIDSSFKVAPTPTVPNLFDNTPEPSSVESTPAPEDSTGDTVMSVTGPPISPSKNSLSSISDHPHEERECHNGAGASVAGPSGVGASGAGPSGVGAGAGPSVSGNGHNGEGNGNDPNECDPSEPSDPSDPSDPNTNDPNNSAKSISSPNSLPLGPLFSKPFTNPFAEVASSGNTTFSTVKNDSADDSESESTAAITAPELLPNRFPGESDEKEVFAEANTVLLKLIKKDDGKQAFKKVGDGLLMRILENKDNNKKRIVVRQRGTWNLLVNSPIVSNMFKESTVPGIITFIAAKDELEYTVYAVKLPSDMVKNNFLNAVAWPTR